MSVERRGRSRFDGTGYVSCSQIPRAFAPAGGSPKRYLVETWYKHPTKVAPEDEPYTMTNLVKKVIEKLRPGAVR